MECADGPEAVAEGLGRADTRHAERTTGVSALGTLDNGAARPWTGRKVITAVRRAQRPLRLRLVLHFLEPHVGFGDAFVHADQASMRGPVHEEHGERFPQRDPRGNWLLDGLRVE